jgi:D-xylose transport system permease protein
MKNNKAGSTAGARLGLDIRTYAMIGTIVVLWAVFEALTSGTYLSARNVSLLVRQMAFVAMLTSGVTLILVDGQVDLSLGSLAGLASGIVAILIVNLGLDIIFAIFLTLCIAALLGTVQGICVARFRIPGFIVTLGGLMAFRGILLGITKSRTIASFPPFFKEIGQGYVAPALGLAIAIVVTGIFVLFQIADRRQKQKYGFELELAPVFIFKQVATAVGIVGATLYINLYQGLPIPILIVAVFAAFLTILSKKTKFGRHVYASGGNPEAAHLSGINVERVTTLLFVISAVYAASGGILLASRLNAGTPSAGTGAELDAIAAAVIGGTSLMGGIGSIPGALIGALVMGSLDNGMSLLNVDIFYQMIIKGVILVAAVGFDINAKR